MKEILSVQAAYIAGAFDSEGNIGLGKTINSNSVSYCYHCSITNTDIRLMDWLINTTKIGKIDIVKRNNSKIKKQEYKWVLQVEEIKELFPIIEPYLIIIAKANNGGGHASAAGFSIPLENL